MKSKELLSKIGSKLTELHLTDLEQGRLCRNLEQVHERLASREYLRASFDDNTFDIPDRAKQLVVEVEFYSLIGRTWSKVFNALEVRNFPRVLDLCPGYTPKVELGLYYSRYDGEVVAINRDSKALQDLQKFIDLFRTEYTFTPVHKEIFSDSLEEYDFVVANHIIDDIAIDLFGTQYGVSPTEIYGTESSFKEFWRNVVAPRSREENLLSLISRLGEALEKLCARGGILLLAQYPSYIERMLNLESVTKFNLEAMNSLAQFLAGHGFEQDSMTLKGALADDGNHFSSDECILLRRKS